MNAVPLHFRLALPLIFGAMWLPAVLLIVFGTTAIINVRTGQDTWIYFLAFAMISCGVLVGYPPEPRGYRALNLSGGTYRRHFIIGLTARLLISGAFLALILMETQHLRWWVLGAILLTIYAAEILTKTTFPEPGSLADRKRRRDGPIVPGTQDDEPSVHDLEKELIVEPQRNFWISVWAAVLVFGAVWMVLSWMWSESETGASAIFTIIIFTLMTSAAGGSISGSLAQWISVGGSRTRWAKKTRWVMLLNPLLGGLLIMGLAIFTSPGARGGLALPASAVLMVPVLINVVQLAGRATLFYVIAAATFVVASVATFIAGMGVLAVVLAIILFVGFEVLLPRIAKDYDHFAGGLRAFLGMQRKPA